MNGRPDLFAGHFVRGCTPNGRSHKPCIYHPQVFNRDPDGRDPKVIGHLSLGLVLSTVPSEHNYVLVLDSRLGQVGWVYVPLVTRFF